MSKDAMMSAGRDVGDLLVEQGKLTAPQLEQVRRRQKRRRAAVNW